MDNYHGFLRSDDNKIKLEASRDILKIVGITGKHTDNPVINQYFTVNNINQIDPQLSSAFGQCFRSLDDDSETIEAEYTDDMSSLEGQD